MRDRIDTLTLLFTLQRFRKIGKLAGIGHFAYIEGGGVARDPDPLQVGFAVEGAGDRVSGFVLRKPGAREREGER